jgi:hypothetical protein
VRTCLKSVSCKFRRSESVIRAKPRREGTCAEVCERKCVRYDLVNADVKCPKLQETAHCKGHQRKFVISENVTEAARADYAMSRDTQ